MKKKSPAPPKRQARGQRRIEQILRAAGEVFDLVGYENASTNAIAARAGVSPGTLYQFFANKQAIAEALANLYAARDLSIQEQAFDFRPANISLHEIVARTVDPFLEFRREAPGFEALFMGSVVSQDLAQRIQSLHNSLKQRVANLIVSVQPALPEETIQTAAEVCVQIVKGLMPLALNGTPEQRKTGATELKSVLERYLTPLVQTTPLKPERP